MGWDESEWNRFQLDQRCYQLILRSSRNHEMRFLQSTLSDAIEPRAHRSARAASNAHRTLAGRTPQMHAGAAVALE
eukprot:5959813-Pyramimonas_sp.AAC.1